MFGGARERFNEVRAIGGFLNKDMERYHADVAEEYLEPIRRAGRELRVAQTELMEERQRASGVTGLDYTKPFVATSAYGDAIPDSLARLAELEAAYQERLDALGELRDEARGLLAEMGGRDACLLRLRYVSALPWNTVAEAMGLSEGTCKNARVPALARFYRYLPHTARPPEQRAFPEKI